MKTKLFRASSILTLTAIVLISSCRRDEERITAQDTQDISEEALIDSYFQDMDDLGTVAINAPDEEELNGGRSKETFTFEVANDTRFRCDGAPLVLTFTRGANSTPDNPSGTITVDFGPDGCTDLQGNTRRGKLIFTFNKRRFTPGATIVTQADNYYINDVRLEGVRTVTNVTPDNTGAPRFNVVLEDGRATFEDGREATRESDITWRWVRATNPVDDRLMIEEGSEANGVTRNERAYEVNVLEELEYKRFCGLAVSGVKRYLIDGDKEISIDYGDGTCDRTATVTINGETRNISLD